MFNLNGKENQKSQSNFYTQEEPQTFYRGYKNYLNNDNAYNPNYRETLANSPRSPLKDDNFKMADLLRDLDTKNHEIVSLNKRIQDLEKVKNEMLLDLEKYENDFQVAEKKFSAKENELTDKIKILEMERGNLQTRLDYHLNSNNNFSEDFLTKENRKLKEEVYAKDEKLDLLLNFLINLQHSILNRTSNMTVLQNLDCITLRSRINEIQDEVHNLVYRTNKNGLEATGPRSPLLSSSRNFRDISEENEKMRLRIERLNSELNQENAFKRSKGFDDFKGLNLNNNYSMYDNKGYTSLNNLSNDKNLNAYNRQQTFNNNFNNSLNPMQIRNGYPIQNAVEIQNNNQQGRESNKTATFNRKLSGEEEIDLLLMDKSKDDQEVGKRDNVEATQHDQPAKPSNEDRVVDMLKSIADKMKDMEEKQTKMLEVQAEHERYLKKNSTDDTARPEPQNNSNVNSSNNNRTGTASGRPNTRSGANSRGGNSGNNRPGNRAGN